MLSLLTARRLPTARLARLLAARLLAARPAAACILLPRRLRPVQSIAPAQSGVPAARRLPLVTARQLQAMARQAGADRRRLLQAAMAAARLIRTPAIRRRLPRRPRAPPERLVTAAAARHRYGQALQRIRHAGGRSRSVERLQHTTAKRLLRIDLSASVRRDGGGHDRGPGGERAWRFSLQRQRVWRRQRRIRQRHNEQPVRRRSSVRLAGLRQFTVRLFRDNDACLRQRGDDNALDRLRLHAKWIGLWHDRRRLRNRCDNEFC